MPATLQGCHDEQLHRGEGDQDDSERNHHPDIAGGAHVGIAELYIGAAASDGFIGEQVTVEYILRHIDPLMAIRGKEVVGYSEDKGDPRKNIWRGPMAILIANKQGHCARPPQFGWDYEGLL